MLRLGIYLIWDWADGVEATRLIKSEFPDIRVIGPSFHEEAEKAQAMLDAGAERHLPKGAPSAELIAAVLRRSTS